MTPSVLPGAEPWSHTAEGDSGVLVLHGFTGNPSSMRLIAEAAAAAGHHVELPRLPGHGTTIDDMLTTTWHDWSGEVRAAHQRLASRADSIVVIGLSMGGALTLWSGLNQPDIAGLVCVNPATRPQGDDVVGMLEEFAAEGTDVMPGIGSDIADPNVSELAYDGMPIKPLLSFFNDGLAAMVERYGELTMPLLLFTSRQDHVVQPADSEYLAERYGGPLEHVWLERSYHVATQDYDRDLIIERTLEFIDRVAGA
jgi:carboxylesterase